MWGKNGGEMIGIGIDIGGTNTKVVALNKKGKVLKEYRFKTLSDLGYPDFLKRISKLINSWKKVLPGDNFIIGMGIAGDINSAEGIIRFCPNLDKWRDIKMAADIRKKTKLRCFIENDANIAAFGVHTLELKKKYKNGIAITLGTGVGGGLIINGEIYNGSCGSAGELGHTNIYPGGTKCNCHMRGCLEAYVGSYGIIGRAKKEIKNIPAFIKKYGKLSSAKKLDTICLSNAAALGNSIALKIWRDTGTYLGIALSDMILILNPEYIVFMGGVSKASKYFLPSIKAVFAKQMIKAPFKKVKLLVSKNPDLGCYGAAVYALEKISDRRKATVNKANNKDRAGNSALAESIYMEYE
ncbi:MAG: ROK family protein [Elusimicrobiales bacterium]|nr:ROK family protein [Elusimicrobiales bacterium]